MKPLGYISPTGSRMEGVLSIFGRFTGFTLLLISALLLLHILIRLSSFVPEFFMVHGVVNLKSTVLDILNLAVVVELAELFIKMNTTHKVSMLLLMDTGIIFALREVIIDLYAEHHSAFGISSPEIALAILILLRVLLHKEKKYGK